MTLKKNHREVLNPRTGCICALSRIVSGLSNVEVNEEGYRVSRFMAHDQIRAVNRPQGRPQILAPLISHSAIVFP